MITALSLLTVVATSTQPGYKLVWSDDFSKAKRLDGSKWEYERGFVRNEEDQLYRPENVRIEHGRLVLEARRERVPNPAYDPSAGNDWRKRRQWAEYTSGCIESRKSWLYGRFEVCGRIDVGPGLWPAIWTLGTEREWPYCGEIDIMEYYQESLFANFAWGKVRRWDAKWHSSARPLSKLAAEAGFASVEDWSSHFHVWRMDWDEDRIRLYVDDKLLNEVALTDTVNEGDHVNPFHSPQRLILDLAIGGINGGDPSGAKFPAKFEIAYVRVYRRA